MKKAALMYNPLDRRHLDCANELKALYAERLDFVTEPDSECDFCIVLGGDGSVMRAAHFAAPLGIPLIGINFGRVGYMAELESTETALIDRVINGEYKIEERMMIRGEYQENYSFSALNDIVASRGGVSQMVDIELSLGGNLISSYHSDGLIIATPTGSTAYSLSAGGAVIDPKMECICITPICPHSLRAKPIVVSDSSVLEIKNVSSRGVELYITADGSALAPLSPGGILRVRRDVAGTKFIKLKKDSFYTVLNRKMSE